MKCASEMWPALIVLFGVFAAPAWAKLPDGPGKAETDDIALANFQNAF